MKYEWQMIKTGSGIGTKFLNTPSGCVVEECEAVVISHPGLNLTPEGDWTPAIGLGPQYADMIAASNEIDQLRSELKVAHELGTELLREMGFNDESQARHSVRDLVVVYRDAHKAEADRIKDLETEIRLHDSDLVKQAKIADVEIERLKGKIHGLDCERLGLNSANAKLEMDCQSLSDRIGELMGRISSIEAWATQPNDNPMLRMAQAHVLKLVRGES